MYMYNLELLLLVVDGEDFRTRVLQHVGDAEHDVDLSLL